MTTQHHRANVTTATCGVFLDDVNHQGNASMGLLQMAEQYPDVVCGPCVEAVSSWMVERVVDRFAAL